jgi:hypothetical protein
MVVMSSVGRELIWSLLAWEIFAELEEASPTTHELVIVGDRGVGLPNSTD